MSVCECACVQGGEVGGAFSFFSLVGEFFQSIFIIILFCFSDLDTSPLEISFPCKGR